MKIFRDDCWYRALTLKERWQLLREDRSEEEVYSQEELSQADDLIERWKAQTPFQERDVFRRRLAQDGMNEEQFLRVVRTRPATLKELSPSPPPWLDTLERAFRDPLELPFEDLNPSRSAESSSLLTLVLPLLASAYHRLRKAFSRFPEDVPWNRERLLRTLHSHLSGRLSMFVRRALVLELQIAGLEGKLSGQTPEERFQSFILQLEDTDTALEILSRYPVLTRKIVECVDQWVVFSTEILERFAQDWPLLSETFCPAGEASIPRSLGRLEEVRPGQGDSHREGRSVCMLTFSSGLELVYKPRPLAGERAFNDLLAWANQRGYEPAFRILRVLDRGDYGWEERILPADCTRREEVQRFYQRQGGNLALLYLLDASDIHFENVIASGEHPILIDLETLFHPPMDVLHDATPLLGPGNLLYRTVGNVGLLPQRIWGTEEQKEGIDLSGLASAEGQLTAQHLLNLEGAGTDQMRFVRKPAEIPEMDHSPRLQGVIPSAGEFCDDLMEGFSRLYRVLIAHRQDLLSPSSTLSSFRSIETRTIFRPTIFYNQLLGESLHPDVIQDALERDLLLDGLWAEVPHFPALERLVPLEQDEMHCIDIPLFTTSPGSLDLQSGSGLRLPGFWKETALSRSQAKLSALSEADLERQLWLIRTSLETLPHLEQRPREPGSLFQEASEAAQPRDFMAAAVAAGVRLKTLAFHGPQGDVTWPIVSPVGNRHWASGPAEPTLYLGLVGIALFLAHLGEIQREESFSALGRQAWNSARGQLSSDRVRLPGIGGFAGWGGVIYAAVHLAALWNDPELLDYAESIVEGLAQGVAEDEIHDIVGGAAGLILSLRSLHELRPSQRTLEIAQRCGESLRAHAVEMETGVGWLLEAAGSKPLGGLSHGAGGIAWALLELASLTGDMSYRALAQQAIAYERTLFSPTEQNWLDLREGDRPEGARQSSEGHFVVGWCHGAPGVALARLAGLRHLDTPEIQREIEIALATTLEQGFGSNHCLCHGDLGNLEVFLVAGELLGDRGLTDRAYRLATGVLAGARDHGWLHGYPGKVEPLGLMVGLAGIGFQLLRLAHPARIPSILTLEPPSKITARINDMN